MYLYDTVDDKFNGYCKKSGIDSNNTEIVMSCLAGSHLYGTNHEKSDIDIKGIFIPPKEFYLGFLRKVENLGTKVNKSTEDDDYDFLEFRKFLKTALECNPTMIELLFIPEQSLIHSSKTYEDIISNRDKFLSSKARHSFTGYAISQLKRIKTHRQYLLNPPSHKPTRTEFGLPEHKSLIHHTQMGAFNKFISNFLHEIKEFHQLKDQLDEMNETFTFESIIQRNPIEDLHILEEFMPGVETKVLESLRRESKYRKAMNEWKKYENWKNTRNKQRAELETKYGYDTKHGAHLVRLIFECKELLETGHITLPRPEAEYLVDIIHGKLSYDELIEMVEGFDKEFETLYNTTKLPKYPDRKFVNKMCVDILGDRLSKKGQSMDYLQEISEFYQSY